MQNATPASEIQAGGTRQFISFTIGDEEYGVDIMAIREIKGWTASTELPNTPEYMRGVINLRGAIVPIFDLRSRFSGGLTQASARHVIIVVSVHDRVIGILVDAVADIITVSAADIQPVPELDHHDHSGFLTGLVTVDGRMVALLDLHQLFDIELVADAITAAA
ncbi:chemotaxis protein CheW [Magnetospirillum gryphiswaldense]|uniref:Chemotaxis protein cheW n=2 Tax=Magnetospirillum gryphiswaldense TaxID=55518 RepID=V6EYC7_MAGGM|nr:chemotaxis protein CheW [Magnetospirillum gryphiswaldense]AVM73767.1 CheW-like domain protein [Magnetospirillum gryphiswaldense MSR-1]AVM77670.1 CheW-like domain protein [Magnetospirillum gryphiswaldense]CAM75481.1 Chemotaxis signal transduction protein [Magnetospirillum gryphiswaldense MSR-1]CDK98199.1 Chemotaxis protein cheW [Magnetospirillum gryphiswaldense MSR-1 v2]